LYWGFFCACIDFIWFQLENSIHIRRITVCTYGRFPVESLSEDVIGCLKLLRSKFPKLLIFLFCYWRLILAFI
jgi:hypothetical protein